MIIALRIHGTERPAVDLPTDRHVYTLGSTGANVIIPDSEGRGVAPIHAIVERIDGGIRVTAHAPDMDLYRTAWTAPVGELLLRRGMAGWICGVRVVAMDAQQVTLRPALSWSMGLDNSAAVDDAISDIANREPLLIVAPPGSEIDRLIAAIHSSDPEAGKLVTSPDGAMPPLPDATIVVNLDGPAMLTAPRVRALTTPQRSQRIVLRTETAGRARAVLGQYIERTRVLTVPPLSARGPEIPRLMQHMWTTDHRVPELVSDLGPEALAGMSAHPWHGGFAELRDQARRVLYYHQTGSVLTTARMLGVKRQTIYAHLHRIGVPTGNAEVRAEREFIRQEEARTARDHAPTGGRPPRRGASKGPGRPPPRLKCAASNRFWGKAPAGAPHQDARRL